MDSNTASNLTDDLSFIVLLGASRVNKLMPRYLDQLSAALIPFHVEPLPQISSPSDGTLGFCTDLWMHLAERFEDYSRLVLTDAWDVLVYGTREQVVSSLPLYPIVVFAAERNCYPEPELAARIGNWGTPWNFVNGGMLTASPSELIRWCEAVRRHPQYDAKMIGQQWLNRRWAENSDLIHIDFHTRLFYCMYREEESPALVNEGGRPFNSLCKTFPPLIHFNGSCAWENFLKMMGEEVNV